MQLKREIKLICTDLDGTLTDGGISVDCQGYETRKYNVVDGQLIKIAQEKGYLFACITSSSSPGIKFRLEKLGFNYIKMGVEDKGRCIKELIRKLDLSTMQVLYVGDDINDISAFDVVGTRVAVNGSSAELMSIADEITNAKGGQGVLREIIEALLGRNYS